jgi:hypothetical protein
VSGWLKLTALLPLPSEVPPVAGLRVPKVALHAPGFVAPYRKKLVVAPPLGEAEPFSVAEVAPTALAAAVVTVGSAAGVVNLSTAPTLVPTEFATMAQKKYVAPGVRPVMTCEKGVALVPLPSAGPLNEGARVPNVSLHVPGLVVA